jgi:Thiopurine S-methyltransferase (TPMT)
MNQRIQTLLARRALLFAKPQAKMSAAASNKKEEYWEEVWTNGVAKRTRFDIGEAEKELVFELERGRAGEGVLSPLFISTKRALVPGCGRGYAVNAFAAAGLKALGLEISSTAVKNAQEDQGHENAEFIEGDFFNRESDVGTFDAVFDSTFLCAINPSLYRAWARFNLNRFCYLFPYIEAWELEHTSERAGFNLNQFCYLFPYIKGWELEHASVRAGLNRFCYLFPYIKDWELDASERAGFTLNQFSYLFP